MRLAPTAEQEAMLSAEQARVRGAYRQGGAHAATQRFNQSPLRHWMLDGAWWASSSDQSDAA